MNYFNIFFLIYIRKRTIVKGLTTHFLKSFKIKFVAALLIHQ